MFSWIANEKTNIKFFLKWKKVLFLAKYLKKNRFRFSTEKPVLRFFPVLSKNRFLTEAKNQFFGLTVSGSPSLK